MNHEFQRAQWKITGAKERGGGDRRIFVQSLVGIGRQEMKGTSCLAFCRD